MPDLRSDDLLIRGVRVRYYEAGDGPALVLLHEVLASHRDFARVVPALAERFRVIVPDLPGFGDSERPREFRYDRAGYAELVCDLLAGAGVAQAQLAGHGFGGAVALTIAADYPERVARLALISVVCYPCDEPLRSRLPLVPLVGPLAFKRLYNRALFHDYFRTNVYAPGFAYDRALTDEHYARFAPADSREAALRVMHAARDLTALGPRIAKVRAPAVVLWGERDPRYPVALGARLARELPRARLETLPDCGHAPHLEQPERTAALLLRHFTAGLAA